METKTIISNVVTAILTATVLGVAASIMGVFEAGSTALDEAQIEAVIKRVMVLDNGDTYAATLSSVNIRLGSIDTNIGTIKEDINDLELSMRDLASE